MAYFNKNLYPYTSKCQTLDAQISGLRYDYAEVQQKRMVGNKQAVSQFKNAKEIQFEKQNCSKQLEDASVYGSIEMTQKEFAELEQRIIGESNKKRQVMLISGSVLLLIGLVIFIK